MNGIGDALSPGAPRWKPASAVASASVLLPPVEGIAMEPTSIEFAQSAHDEPCGARTGASDPVTPKCPMPQCAQERHSMRVKRRQAAMGT
jgi:hypothetical protein